MANHTSILPSFFTSLIWMILLITATIIMARVWLTVTCRGRSGSAIVNLPQDVPVIRRLILTISEAKFFRALREVVERSTSFFPSFPYGP
jgi:hypothetical protein